MKHLSALTLVLVAFANASESVSLPGQPADPGHIHVDQFGYLPGDPKIAVLSDPQVGFNSGDRYAPGGHLEVRRTSDSAEVYRGAPTLFDKGRTDAISGDRGWWFDFSPVSAPGDYYILDPANGTRSHVFRVAEDVYEPVLRAAVRVFYYQRASAAHVAPWAEAPWQDGPAFQQDDAARAVWSPGDAASTRDLSGGWMDAGDTNKYPSFLGEVVHPLLYAWRSNPAVFTDDFDIPESGNSLPDLLDEVKWELEWLCKMQDADGGVFIKMGMATKRGDEIANRAVSPLSRDLRQRYYAPKCSASTIIAAGVFAHAARIYGEFEPWKPFAAELRERAELAWQWYTTHPRSSDCDTRAVMSGWANLTFTAQDAAAAVAAMHLWVLTADERYHGEFREKMGTMRQLSDQAWSYYRMGQGEVLFDYLRQLNADRAICERIICAYTKAIGSPLFMPQDGKDELYRAWMPEACYHWGSNRTRACWGIAALCGVALNLNNEERDGLRQRALNLLHAIHGVNPIGLVYLTNMARYGAESSAQHIYHEWFGHAPPPGYLTGGPNRNYTGSLAWIRQQPPAKAYADISEDRMVNGYELTEPAIYYQACYIRLMTPFVAQHSNKKSGPARSGADIEH